MKNLFLISAIILIASSFLIMFTQPGYDDGITQISWKTDSNPQRYEQAELFEQWLIKNGHVDDDGKPEVKVVIDSSTNQSSLIQAVSGVGGDMIDALIFQYQPMGLCDDISEDAKQYGYSIDRAYPQFSWMMAVDGRQYGCAANAFCRNVWANVDTFRKYGMEPPPEEWTPEEFERIGKEFTRRANEGKERQEVFFIQSLIGEGYHLFLTIYRSQGVDLYNETLTSSNLENPVFADLFKLIYKWTYVDKLCPTPAETASMSADASLGRSCFTHFVSGRYAMITDVRSTVIPMRKSSFRPNISTSQMPMYEFKNMPLAVRPLILYKGSKNKDLAKLFFRFLASREYSEHIIKSGDGLPPIPEYAMDNPDFLNPLEYPNEGNLHANELKWATTIAYGMPYTPYRSAEGGNWMMESMSRYFNGLDTAEEAAAYGKRRYDESISTTLRNNPTLKKRWEEACAIQQRIDSYKAEGRKIPARWIKNPFYLDYYRAKNMLEE